MKRALIAVSIGCVVFMGIMVGLMLASNEISKESNVVGTGGGHKAMRAKSVTGTGEMVATENPVAYATLGDLRHLPIKAIHAMNEITLTDTTRGLHVYKISGLSFPNKYSDLSIFFFSGRSLHIDTNNNAQLRVVSADGKNTTALKVVMPKPSKVHTRRRELFSREGSDLHERCADAQNVGGKVCLHSLEEIHHLHGRSLAKTTATDVDEDSSTISYAQVAADGQGAMGKSDAINTASELVNARFGEDDGSGVVDSSFATVVSFTFLDRCSNYGLSSCDTLPSGDAFDDELPYPGTKFVLDEIEEEEEEKEEAETATNVNASVSASGLIGDWFFVDKVEYTVGHDKDGGKFTKAVLRYGHDTLSSIRTRVMMFAQKGENFNGTAGTSRYFEYDEVVRDGTVVKMNCGKEDVVPGTTTSASDDDEAEEGPASTPSGRVGSSSRRLREDAEHHHFILEKIRKHMPGFAGIVHRRLEETTDDTPPIEFATASSSDDVYGVGFAEDENGDMVLVKTEEPVDAPNADVLINMYNDVEFNSISVDSFFWPDETACLAETNTTDTPAIAKRSSLDDTLEVATARRLEGEEEPVDFDRGARQLAEEIQPHIARILQTKQEAERQLTVKGATAFLQDRRPFKTKLIEQLQKEKKARIKSWKDEAKAIKASACMTKACRKEMAKGAMKAEADKYKAFAKDAVNKKLAIPPARGTCKKVVSEGEDFDKNIVKLVDDPLTAIDAQVQVIRDAIAEVKGVESTMSDMKDVVLLTKVVCKPLGAFPFVGPLFKVLGMAVTKAEIPIKKMADELVKLNKDIAKKKFDAKLVKLQGSIATVGVASENVRATYVKYSSYLLAADGWCTPASDLTRVVTQGVCTATAKTAGAANDKLGVLVKQAAKVEKVLNDLTTFAKKINALVKNPVYEQLAKFMKTLDPVLKPLMAFLNKKYSITFPWVEMVPHTTCLKVYYPCGVKKCSKKISYPSCGWSGCRMKKKTIKYPCGVKTCDKNVCATVKLPSVFMKLFKFSVMDILQGLSGALDVLMGPFNKIIDAAFKALGVPDLGKLLQDLMDDIGFPTKFPALPTLPSLKLPTFGSFSGKDTSKCPTGSTALPSTGLSAPKVREIHTTWHVID